MAFTFTREVEESSGSERAIYGMFRADSGTAAGVIQTDLRVVKSFFTQASSAASDIRITAPVLPVTLGGPLSPSGGNITLAFTANSEGTYRATGY